jgi:hypothetical protein
VDVIGARFTDLESAAAARQAILAAVAMPAADIAVRALGTTRYDQPIEAYVLGGRFPASHAHLVMRIAREHGGTILSHRAEWRPAPRPGTDRAARSQRPAGRARRAGLGTAGRKRPRRPAARLRVRAAHGARLKA